MSIAVDGRYSLLDIMAFPASCWAARFPLVLRVRLEDAFAFARMQPLRTVRRCRCLSLLTSHWSAMGDVFSGHWQSGKGSGLRLSLMICAGSGNTLIRVYHGRAGETSWAIQGCRKTFPQHSWATCDSEGFSSTHCNCCFEEYCDLAFQA